MIYLVVCSGRLGGLSGGLPSSVTTITSSSLSTSCIQQIQDNDKLALEAFRTGAVTCFNHNANKQCCTRSVLQSHLKDRLTRKDSHVMEQIVSPQQKVDLANWIVDLDVTKMLLR